MHFVCEIHFATPLILKHTDIDINNAFANRQHIFIIVFNATSTTTFHGFGIFYHTMSLPFSSRLIVTCTESQESHCVAPTNIS